MWRWILLVSLFGSVSRASSVVMYAEHDFTVPLSDSYNFTFSVGSAELSQAISPIDGEGFSLLTDTEPAKQVALDLISAGPNPIVTMAVNSSSIQIPLHTNFAGYTLDDFCIAVHGFESPTSTEFEIFVSSSGVPEPSPLALIPFALVMSGRRSRTRSSYSRP